MDENVFHQCSESAVSSAVGCSSNTGSTSQSKDINSDFLINHSFNNPTRQASIENFRANISRATSAIYAMKPSSSKNMGSKNNDNCIQYNDSMEAVCHVNLDSIMKLKESTRKLICLLEGLEIKTHSKQTVHDVAPYLTDLIKPIPQTFEFPADIDINGAAALNRLESQANNLDGIYIEDEEDDCSVYKRLTRKCYCLNSQDYNDLIMLFNEETKYFTTNFGEIIKNMRILKKFLYMGGGYTKSALLFLNEGLSESSHSEKVEITQGCAHADICNVFEEHSIVTVCLSWPCNYYNCGDKISQCLAARFLYKLAQLEEGRRYLKFSSKITNDMRKVLRKTASKLEFDTLELLTATLSLMHPPISQHLNVSYYCKPVDEGTGIKIVNALIHYRRFMTLDEIFTHLQLLHNLSNSDYGKTELAYLPKLLTLFKQILIDYDNSDMNILVTNILNNIVCTNIIMREKELNLPKTMIIADTATEPIKMKNEVVQIPLKKNVNTKKSTNKSKLAFGSQNKFRQQSKRRVPEWEHPRQINISKKFSPEPRNGIIIVPIE